MSAYEIARDLRLIEKDLVDFYDGHTFAEIEGMECRKIYDEVT